MEKKKEKKNNQRFFLTNSVALTQKVGMRNVSDEGFGARRPRLTKQHLHSCVT